MTPLDGVPAPAQPEDCLLTVAALCAAHWTQPLTPREGDGAALSSPGHLVIRRTGVVGLPWTSDQFCEIDPAPLLALVDDEKAQERDFQKVLAQFRDAGAPVMESAALWAYLMTLEEVGFGIHLHPMVVTQILCSPRARQFADRRMTPQEVTGTGCASVLVNYADPGLESAREMKRRVVYWRSRFKAVPRILLLANNGIILLGPDVTSLMERLEDLARHAKNFVGASMLGGPVFLTPTNVEKLQRIYGLPVFGVGAPEKEQSGAVPFGG